MKKPELQPLGDLVTIVMGQAPPGSETNFGGRGTPFVKAGEFAGERPIIREWTTKPLKLARRSDVLICVVGATCGKLNLGEDCAIGRSVASIRPDSRRLDQRFLYFFLQTLVLELRGGSLGAAQTVISREMISQIRIPTLSLQEQERIVAILDEAFEGIARVAANTREVLQDAQALSNSPFGTIASREEQSRWVKTTVREIAAPHKGAIRTGPFGSQLLHTEFVEAGIAVLGIDNAVANEFRWGKSRFISLEKYSQLERYRVRPGDVLITIMGTCGRCAVVPEDVPTAINTKHLCCITLDRSKCLPSYLHAYFLSHPVAQDYLSKRAKGSIMAGLNMGLIQELPVLLPPLERQRSFVTELEVMQTEIRRFGLAEQTKLSALDELKQSLLHQAFSGNL